MKILSNFDTKLYNKLHHEYSEKYWVEHIVTVKRSHMYFLVFVATPFIALLSIYIIVSYIMTTLLPSIWDETIANLISIILLVLSLWVTIRYGIWIIWKLIDYAMDFCIITPYEIVYYNQDWILNRRTEIIDTEKIKTITKDSSWFIKSFLNYWDIVFLSEWDKDIWDISLDWVENPESMYQKVRNIIEPHMNAAMRDKISKTKQVKENV
jgi:hypothetical protein